MTESAARDMQKPDQKIPPSASDGRCQPTKRTPVANEALRRPATIAIHGRHRVGLTKINAIASDVPTVVCPLGYVDRSRSSGSWVSSDTSACHGSVCFTSSPPAAAQANATAMMAARSNNAENADHQNENNGDHEGAAADIIVDRANNIRRCRHYPARKTAHDHTCIKI